MIAGALVMGPELIVADEPVSMLDVSIRTELLRLMLDLRTERGLTYLFITHDLSLAWVIADRIAVMYLGRIMEIGAAEDVIKDSHHPYTRALVGVSPSPDPVDDATRASRTILSGETPNAAAIPSAAGSIRAARSRSTVADRGAAAVRHRERPAGGLLAGRGRTRALPVFQPAVAAGRRRAAPDVRGRRGRRRHAAGRRGEPASVTPPPLDIDRNHIGEVLAIAQAWVLPQMGNARRFVDPTA